MYKQTVEDTRAKLTGVLYGALDSVGLGVPEATRPPIPATKAPKSVFDDEGVDQAP